MSLAAIVMAAGRGTRMGSATPKPLLPLAGRQMVDWVIEALGGLDLDRLVVVVSPETRHAFPGVEVAVQDEPTGTGGAAAAARPLFGDFDGDLVVVAADTPLIRTTTLAALLDAHRHATAGVTILSLESPDPLAYGRVVRDDSGALQAVVEEGDATADEAAIAELNSSIYVFRAGALWAALRRLDRNNAKRELQLTSAVRLVVERGLPGAAVRVADPIEAHGVNTPADLALAESVLRRRLPLQD